jgi:hypothetical protein
MRLSILGCAAILASTVFGGMASAVSIVGNGGIGSPNGDVTAPPDAAKYYYVSTFNGVGAAANGIGLGLGGETNGSKLTTDTFSANQGSVLNFYFNYVTSDGTPSYIEYAYALLVNTVSNVETLIFTARTNPFGTDTVPGFDLPPIAAGVVLDPPSSLILDGKTNWDKLGGSSGACFGGLGAGCGSTDWIKSTVTIAEAGTYKAIFGVINWGDTALDTGLAISGLTIDDDPVLPPAVVPLPATVWLLGGAMAGLVGWRKRRAA